MKEGTCIAIKKKIEMIPWLGNKMIVYFFRLKALLTPRRVWQAKVRHSRFLRYKIAKSEAERIQEALKSGSLKKTVIIYDLKANPPTYGDFICVIMLARFLILNNVLVELRIVNSEYRWDWHDVIGNDKKIEVFVADLIECARVILGDNSNRIGLFSWKKVEMEMPELLRLGCFILFEEQVSLRNPIHGHCINALNPFLMASAEENVRNRFLLSADILIEGGVLANIPKRPYVVAICRFSKYCKERNISEEEFCYIYSQLRTRFPDCDILIVSDMLGCLHFKAIAARKDLKCLFSKDHSDSFLGDGLLILKSEFCFQLRGGGIGMFALFSKNSYEIAAPSITELGAGDKFAIWQGDNQIYLNSHVRYDKKKNGRISWTP